jgi:hypothetical protein
MTALGSYGLGSVTPNADQWTQADVNRRNGDKPAKAGGRAVFGFMITSEAPDRRI